MSKRRPPPTTTKGKGTSAEDGGDKKIKLDSIPTGTFTNILQTDVIVLGTKGSDSEFRIHTGLLKSKCSALYKSHIEKAVDDYVCMDTEASTLSALVGWVYTGEYPEKADLEKSDIKCISNNEESVECKIADSISDNIQLYVFCDRHSIPELASLAITQMKKIIRIHVSVALTSAARFALSKLKENDPLFAYLAHFAAYHIEILRCSGSFCTLLSDHPNFAFSILHYAGPAKKKPE
ncbi:hypothetical protein BO83DRAFT_400284 [Aspergillus eucalypticola CBS 122712]|uniref:BTB domain-containing protein n=1 Tax=Aspergillus eucalypticola (strain CBS 122712 / IBT 29274) TaxID=1448314 RepID=A0A317V8P1_ASPEC|nr:uncharacterized protein BO83DRAFT_400284 [Aspergillus eucalypticola CBS 122712]PWY69367.1 hypothetical protein BO83DRAFT_400284 [Aspergillus eucalypticola CBS 122712]